MLKNITLLLLLAVQTLVAQVPAYYQTLDLSQTGENLKSQLTTLISNHTEFPYSSSATDTWDILQVCDLESGTDVLLVYGYNDTDGISSNDRLRDVSLMCNFSGSCVGFWNREHVYPQSLATPPLTTSSAGSGTDLHNLRAADTQMNSTRNNNLFETGSGDAGLTANGFYPGDEFKGDVARIIMYMYTRYPSQCPANNVGFGATTYNSNIPDILLEWNVEDPVSPFEINRNEVVFSYQGNRNPYIDNPYLANVIWGGPTAEDRWGGTQDTLISFTEAGLSVAENDGIINLTVGITNASAQNATTAQVVLTAGDAADVGAYTTQSITFPAGSSSNQTVSISITDDLLVEGTETLTFSLQQISGGTNAAAGTTGNFDLSITDNDGVSVVIAIEDFDASTPAWTNDIASQTFVDPDSSNQGLFIQTASGNHPNFTGNTALGRDLEGEAGEPTLSPFTFTFNAVNVSAYDAVVLSFDYHAFANADAGSYEVLLDDVGQGAVSFFNDPDVAPGVNGTVSVNIPNGTTTVALVLTGTLNGASDVIELDNFKLEGIFIPTPVDYTFDGVSWSPQDPNGATSGLDHLTITSGHAEISSTTTVNRITVQPGAALTVTSGTTLTIMDELLLESVSTAYASLILDGAITGNLRYERYVNVIGVSGGNDLITPPLSGQRFEDFALANDGELAAWGNIRAFAPFNNGVGAYQNYSVVTHANTTMSAGTGYRAATVGGATLSFTGTAATGIVSVDISAPQGLLGSWNLIGNPYPSYINMAAFLSHEVAPGVSNLSLLANPSGIYGYDGFASDGWDVVTLANAGSRLMAPGQGFFVSANAAAVAAYNIEFTPDMRTFGADDDFIAGRSETPLYLKLNATAGSNNYQTQFYFNEQASEGLDPGYDAQTWGGLVSGFMLYSHLPVDNTGVPMALQALHPDAVNDLIIPLGINSDAGEQLTISISESHLPTGTEVYLEDTVQQTYTPLHEMDFILTPGSSLNGTGRFFLRFGNGTLSNDDFDTEALNIYHQPASGTVVIAGQLQHNSMAYLYDLQGRVVRTTALKVAALEQQVDVNGLSTGVYVLSFEQNGTVVSEKLILR